MQRAEGRHRGRESREVRGELDSLPEAWNQWRGSLKERLSALEYLRAETERLVAEQPGTGAVLVSVTLTAVRDSIREVVDLLGDMEP